MSSSPVLVEHINVTTSMDPFLSVSAAAKHASVSKDTIRAWIRDPEHPLPHYQPLRGGKILILLSELNGWIAQWRSVGRRDAQLDAALARINAGRPRR